MSSYVLKAKRVLDITLNVVATTLLSILVAVVIAQVISRYGFNRPFRWSEELARYMLVWVVFLFAAIAFRQKRHLGIDFFVEQLPSTVRTAVRVLTNLLIFAFLVLVIRYSPRLIAITSRQTSAALGIPMGLVYLSFPVSTGLMIIDQGFQLYTLLREKLS